MKIKNRRQFLKTSAAVGAAIAAPTIVPSSALGLGGAVAPSDRIVVGGLGIGPRGTTDLKCFLANSDVQFVGVADLQKSRRDAVKTLVDGTYGNKDCVVYQDMYEILGRDDVDALLIATGDRWHTMASILAAKAGKDVYCEKPCSLTIAESRALADAYRKYNRVYQAGTQRRTIGNFEFAKDLVQEGRLGKIHTIHANTRPPATSHSLAACRTRNLRKTFAIGIVGSVHVRGGLTILHMSVVAGAGILIFMAAEFSNGVHTRLTSASGQPAETTRHRLNTFRMLMEWNAFMPMA